MDILDINYSKLSYHNNKTCSKCGNEYPRTHEYWHRNKNKKDGLRIYCKGCCIQYTKDHKEEIEKRRVERESSPEGKRIKRNSTLLYRYGITLNFYEHLLKLQNGRCFICGGKNNGKALHVDHNHKTGKVRQLLCYSCNIYIGTIETWYIKYKKVIDKYLNLLEE